MYREELEIARREVEDWRDLRDRLRTERRTGIMMLTGGSATALTWFWILGTQGFIVPLICLGAVIVGAGQVYTGRSHLLRAEQELARWEAALAEHRRIEGGEVAGRHGPGDPG